MATQLCNVRGLDLLRIKWVNLMVVLSIIIMILLIITGNSSPTYNIINNNNIKTEVDDQNAAAIGSYLYSANDQVIKEPTGSLTLRKFNLYDGRNIYATRRWPELSCARDPDVCKRKVAMQFVQEELSGEISSGGGGGGGGGGRRNSADMECCWGRVCRDTWVDVFNCGGCGVVCPPTMTCCGGACADLHIDPNNCGSCGVSCLPGTVCELGLCGYAADETPLPL